MREQASSQGFSWENLQVVNWCLWKASQCQRLCFGFGFGFLGNGLSLSDPFLVHHLPHLSTGCQGAASWTDLEHQGCMPSRASYLFHKPLGATTFVSCNECVCPRGPGASISCQNSMYSLRGPVTNTCHHDLACYMARM